MQRIQGQPAFVLHQRPYRNTSLLLEVFSRDHGRLGLVARGGRKSRQAALLQPFVPLRLDWTLREDLGSLAAVDADGGPLPLAGPALVCGFYLNELLYRLCHRHDPHPQLFQAYGRALPALAGGPVEPVLRHFEYQLLVELGYAPLLRQTADRGQPVQAHKQYHYVPEQGPLERPSGPDGIEISGRALLALDAGELDGPEVLAEVRRLLRACLAPLLGGRPLRSRELYRSMLKLGKHHEH